MSEVAERLVRIEESQRVQGDQIARMLELLERMVRVEERQSSMTRVITGLGHRLEKLESRCDAIDRDTQEGRHHWKIVAWVVGATASVGTGIVLAAIRNW